MVSALHLVHLVSNDKLSVEIGSPSTTSFTFVTDFKSICWPCSSTWVLLRHLTYDRPSEKGRAETMTCAFIPQGHSVQKLSLLRRHLYSGWNHQREPPLLNPGLLWQTDGCQGAAGARASCCAGIPGVPGLRQGQQPGQTLLSASVHHTWQSTCFHPT